MSTYDRENSGLLAYADFVEIIAEKIS